MDRYELLSVAATVRSDFPVGEADSSPVIVLSGPLVAGCHAEQLIGAFHVYTRYLNPSARCVIVATGDAPDSAGYKAKLWTMIRQLALPRVQVFEYSTAEERIACLGRADVFVSFADDDMVDPVRLAAAMTLHAPVIARDSAAHRTVLGDAACCVDPARATVVAEAIDQILSRPALSGTFRRRGEARSVDLAWRGDNV